MDLIYTNAQRIDQGVLSAYAFDLSYGASENDFEITVEKNAGIEIGSTVYIDGTEYGGIVDGLKVSSSSETIAYTGRTWHGILNSKVIEPGYGWDYVTVSGDANEVIAFLLSSLRLMGLFVAADDMSGINIPGYQFPRYCKCYDGIKAMLAAHGAKLQIRWVGRFVVLSAVPVADYTDSPVDGDIAVLNVEQYSKRVNHLICLGRGELKDREVIHLYADQFGMIGDYQHFVDLEEIVDTYDNSNAESVEELRKGGIERLTELRNTDKAEVSISEIEGLSYDIGDIIGASEIMSGVRIAATVSQKIVKINNGVINTEYKAGG